MRSNFKELINHAFESVDDSAEKKPTSNKEHEIVIYAKIGDVEGLSKAKSKESHEQWEVKTPKGRVRVRKTMKADIESTYVLTFKTKDTEMGVSGNIEQNFDIDEKMFESFKALSDQGMIKDRYLFEVESVRVSGTDGERDILVKNMNYEVDVFFTTDETGKKTFAPWCKIDLEINPLMDEIQENHTDIGNFTLLIKAVKLPFVPSDMLLSTDQDVNTKEQISKLYDQYFLTKK